MFPIEPTRPTHPADDHETPWWEPWLSRRRRRRLYDMTPRAARATVASAAVSSLVTFGLLHVLGMHDAPAHDSRPHDAQAPAGNATAPADVHAGTSASPIDPNAPSSCAAPADPGEQPTNATTRLPLR